MNEDFHGVFLLFWCFWMCSFTVSAFFWIVRRMMISMSTSKIYIASFLFLLRDFSCQGKKRMYWWCCQLDVLLTSQFVLCFVSRKFSRCSEEIRGEVLFVLYKLYFLQSKSAEGDGSDILIPFCPKLLYLLTDVLMKTQNDDVRLNCIGPLPTFR